MITLAEARVTPIAEVRVGDIVAYGGGLTARTTALVTDKRGLTLETSRLTLHHYRTPVTLDMPDAAFVTVEGHDPFYRAAWVYVRTYMPELTPDDAVEFGLEWSRLAHAEQDRSGLGDDAYTQHSVVQGGVIGWMNRQGIDYLP